MYRDSSFQFTDPGRAQGAGQGAAGAAPCCSTHTTDSSCREMLVRPTDSKAEEGMALLVAITALALLSTLGLYLALNATTDLRISDNGESILQARYAAMAGLNHARTVIGGVHFDDLLKGPDGVNDTSFAYINQARTFSFRNPIPWAAARSLNITDPTHDLSGIADDGLVNSGKRGGITGTVLIPLTGIALLAPNPSGAGNITTSRYFVKVSDNNGEASELAKDPYNDPFADGDGAVLVRSIGVAQTIRESAGGVARWNSLSVFEARFQLRTTFDLGSPLVLQGNQVRAGFSGSGLSISGASSAAILTIDTVPGDGIHPDQILRAAATGKGYITGGGLPAPSIQDGTGPIGANPIQSQLLRPDYLYGFVNDFVPSFADSVYIGDQYWAAGSIPYMGFFDPTRPYSAAGQDPKVTLVKGSLAVDGNFRGGGLLVVAGDFSCNGSFTYDGLVLVIGGGRVIVDGSCGIHGGLYVAKLISSGGMITFGDADFSMNQNSIISANAGAADMAIRLMPPLQTGFREITSTVDP